MKVLWGMCQIPSRWEGRRIVSAAVPLLKMHTSVHSTSGEAVVRRCYAPIWVRKVGMRGGVNARGVLAGPEKRVSIV